MVVFLVRRLKVVELFFGTLRSIVVDKEGDREVEVLAFVDDYMRDINHKRIRLINYTRLSILYTRKHGLKKVSRLVIVPVDTTSYMK